MVVVETLLERVMNACWLFDGASSFQLPRNQMARDPEMRHELVVVDLSGPPHAKSGSKCHSFPRLAFVAVPAAPPLYQQH